MGNGRSLLELVAGVLGLAWIGVCLGTYWILMDRPMTEETRRAPTPVEPLDGPALALLACLITIGLAARGYSWWREGKRAARLQYRER